ncbi:protein unc-93 homolog A-like [Saccostrea echinata]|uniref:protein unc-93 homolog A-like n=1 Tax=Saccostrea echinata TaxID=191078 RepID=UPI002A8147C3|nr:protein unc-93 homolog A-like [Saccostrea echinata]XP_061169977.1 protein unc-93 homolog A-like [Saccostrea echinata]
MQGHYNETTTNASESGNIKVCGADLCPEHSVTEIQFSLPDPLTVKILMSVFVTFSIIGLLLCIFLLPPLPTTVTSTNNSVIRKMLSATCFCLRVNTEVEMILFIPSIVLLSSVETFRWIGVSKAYISCPFGVQFVGFSMALHGLLSGVSSIFLPRLANFISRKYVVTSLIIGITITHVVFLIWTPVNDELPQMMGFISIQGVLEGGLSTMLCAFLSFMYPKKTDAAFASLATWKSLGNTAFIILAYYLCESARLYIIYALCILSMTTYVALELRLRLRKNKPEINDEQEDESNKELKMSDD